MSQRHSVSSDPQNNLACFPYGVGHGDEGVCLLLHMGPHRILLDCGLETINSLRADDQPASLVFCSHAHADHAKGLLALHEAFPQLPIYASEVTVQLLPLNWQELPQQPAQFCQALPWQTQIELGDGLSAELFPAGHIPGAAAILLTYKTSERSYKLLYTGDFCLSNFQLVEGLSIDSLRGISPDVLIIEGSYGTTRHPHRRQQEKQLMECIYQAILSGKNVLLPTPALGLAQEILKLLRSHHQFTGRDLDIWVDGSVAQACDLYLNLLPQFPASVQNFAKHQSLFWDERVCPRMRRLSAHHQPEQSPYIVLTDYTTNLLSYCPPESGSWLVLLPEHPRHLFTPDAHQLAILKKSPRINLSTYLLAEHSDGRNTTQLIHNLRPQHVVFVHGAPNYLADLTGLEELQNRYQLHSPAAGTLVKLPLGEQFIQPTAPLQPYYEGELNETESVVTITLPDGISADPRWSSFADTGLIEARWQGEELMLRGLTQRELSQGHANTLLDLECCGTCLHYRNQHCWNQASHLYGFKVTPAGYCPVYEPLQEEWETDD